MSYYSVKKVYEARNGDQINVNWDRVVWDRLRIPKHRFIAWLAVQAKLQTTEKPALYGELKDWLNIIIQTDDLQHLIAKIQHSYRSKFRKQVVFAGLITMIYFIWQNRNSAYWKHCVRSARADMKQLKHIVKSRILVVLPKKISRADYEWLMKL
ncbi:uncharacterized protein LOC104896514 [Beta vulgaris subsp. vulgaris]|uniref:uncharacterized protein LOC104896514 n=1 Tax=Beta vulgaris subsp. vulgaris TaxID=3555 RepID=UPI0020369C07|nr:uncharacterized protein LOC104896514 [Beta vulgaris subsp. vulgaris]